MHAASAAAGGGVLGGAAGGGVLGGVGGVLGDGGGGLGTADRSGFEAACAARAARFAKDAREVPTGVGKFAPPPGIWLQAHKDHA